MRRTRVKICGITSPAQAAECAALGADAIGIVFYSKSSRAVSELSVAREIALAAGPFCTVTGLFVDASEALIRQVLATVPLGCLQFHGNESRTECERYGRPYIKAIRMRAGVQAEVELAAYAGAQGVLFDAYVPGLPGGTGARFDWSALPPPVRRQCPLILAGGLTPGNVGQAIAEVAPAALDVSGGVESAPGVKDMVAVAEFIAAAASAR